MKFGSDRILLGHLRATQDINWQIQLSLDLPVSQPISLSRVSLSPPISLSVLSLPHFAQERQIDESVRGNFGGDPGLLPDLIDNRLKDGLLDVAIGIHDLS